MSRSTEPRRQANRRLPAVLRAEDGISLVEVLIAILILTVGVLALMSVASASLSSLTRSEQRQDAYTAATRSIEVLRTYDWDHLALDLDDVLIEDFLTGFDPIEGTIAAPGGASADAEDVIASTVGQVTDPPHQFDTDQLRVRTIVTSYFDDPADPDAEQRRITVVVEFGIGDRLEVVRQSTLVTRATWGVGQPDFSVSPISARLPLERGRVDCIDHLVVNLGQQDRYRFDVPSVGTMPPGFVEDVVFYEIDPETGDEIDSWKPALLPDRYTSPYMAPGNDPDPLHPDRFVARFCYELGTNAPGGAEFLDAPVTVEPEAQPQFSQVLFHTVVLEAERTLYLRSDGADSWEPGEIYELMTEPPEVESLPDFDDDGIDGLTLQVGSSDAAAWRVAFSRTRTLEDAVLRLYTAALYDGGLQTSDGLVLGVVLRVRDADGTVDRVLDDDEFTAQGNGTWTLQDWDLGVDGDVVDAGESLELVITCEEDTNPVVIPEVTDELGDVVVPEQVIPRDCVLAFDAEDFASHLSLEFP